MKITGRLKDVILRSGVPIHPAEVEEILYSLPEVSEVQVFGFPHEEFGHEVAAWIKLKKGARLTLEDLAFLLWCTQGVKKVTGTYATFRTVPSAGARHALETYLLVNDVKGLKPGLYRYLALTHRLQQIDLDPTLYIRIAQACLDQQFIMRCGVVFLWVAVPYRMTWRYSERGYREQHKDAGHVCQNLYLAAQAVGCGVCAIAAYEDDVMHEILGIDGENRS